MDVKTLAELYMGLTNSRNDDKSKVYYDYVWASDKPYKISPHGLAEILDKNEGGQEVVVKF